LADRVEEVFEDLLRFVFPDADKVYDMERGFEFLDKELAETVQRVFSGGNQVQFTENAF
jgi:hypothetical protein